MYKARK